jgi:hypothetical protein
VSVVGVCLGTCYEVLAGGNLDLLLLLAHLRGSAWALVLMSLGVVVVEVGAGVLVFTLARSWVGWDG